MTDGESNIAGAVDTQDANRGDPIIEPGGPVARLLSLTEQLTNVINQEITILKDRRPRDIEALQPEKERLGRQYREEYQTLKRRPELLGPEDSPIRQRLRKTTETFNARLIELGRITLRMKSVTEGIVRAIADEVERQQPSVGNYSAMATATGAKHRRAAPLSLNQII